MIEIQNIEKIDKGNLLAMCDVYIKPWHTILREVKIFQKGAQRFISMPSRSYQNHEGETKYLELIQFDSDSVKNRFRNQIMEAIDKYLESNPEMKPEEVIKADDLPF